MGPQQTTVDDVRIGEPVDKIQVTEGIVIPAEGELTSRSCDFMESIWSGQEKFTVTLTNWGSLSLMLEKGDLVKKYTW